MENINIILNASSKDNVAYGAFCVFADGRILKISPDKAGVPVDSNNIARCERFNGLTTSNQAGYGVLTYAARYAARVQRASKKKYHFTFRLANSLVVKQVNGDWKVKDPDLLNLKDTAFKFLDQLADWSIVQTK